MTPPAATDGTDDTRWAERFRAWTVSGATVASGAPTRGMVLSNRPGRTQAHAWHVDTGELRPLTDRPTGLALAFLDPKGRWVTYLDDRGGDEVGVLVRVPWTGGAAEPWHPDLDPAALAGFATSLDGTTIGHTAASRDGFACHVAHVDDDGTTTQPQVRFQETALSIGPLLSADGTTLVMATAAGSGSIDLHPVVVDVESGERIAELAVSDARIRPIAWSPVRDDGRLLLSSDQSGFALPVVWDPATGDRTEPDPDATARLDGELLPRAWWPDAGSVLLEQVSEATTRLHRWSLTDGSVTALGHEPMTVGGADVLDDGRVVVQAGDSTHPARVLMLDPASGDAHDVLKGGDAPAGSRWRSVRYPSSDDSVIQAWLATPHGDGPHPAVVDVHGGPTTAQFDTWSPRIQAWVDRGFAVLSINYRGSTTFGRAFEASIRGELGRREADDVAAGRDWLVDQGIADPARVVVTGWSYGGYLTLLCLGRSPDRWVAGVAGIAIADWVLMYEDQVETLRQYQVGLFGGTPEELPEQHAASSPITYAEAVRAPVLVIQGRNDARCPARQLEAYEDLMRSFDKEIRVDWFDAGHGSYDVELQIEHQRDAMEFVEGVLARTS
ncbi:MAG: prolyl oligopeptidase family serine peptidase [Actinomycetota bacterium]